MTCVLVTGMAGCSEELLSIDRTDFDLDACAAGETSAFASITPATPVDYLEMRSDFGGEGVVGVRCSTATDATACEQALANLTPPSDGWIAAPGGGAAPPHHYLVYTRGDEVGAVGQSGLAAFLAPIENPSDAAFLAHVATAGAVDCSAPSVRALGDGYEVITTRHHSCGGRVEEIRTSVDAEGVATIIETVTVVEGEELLCP